MKPNLVFMIYQEVNSLDKRLQTIVNDGVYFWQYPLVIEDNAYLKVKLKQSNYLPLSNTDELLSIFFDLSKWLRTYSLTQRFKLVETKTWNGSWYRVLTHQEMQPGWDNKTFRAVTTLVVNQNNIVQRVNHRFDEIVNGKDTKNGSNDELSLTNIKLNIPLTRKQFQAKPPAGSVQSK